MDGMQHQNGVSWVQRCCMDTSLTLSPQALKRPHGASERLGAGPPAHAGRDNAAAGGSSHGHGARTPTPRFDELRVNKKECSNKEALSSQETPWSSRHPPLIRTATGRGQAGSSSQNSSHCLKAKEHSPETLQTQSAPLRSAPAAEPTALPSLQPRGAAANAQASPPTLQSLQASSTLSRANAASYCSCGYFEVRQRQRW